MLSKHVTAIQPINKRPYGGPLMQGQWSEDWGIDLEWMGQNLEQRSSDECEQGDKVWGVYIRVHARGDMDASTSSPQWHSRKPAHILVEFGNRAALSISPPVLLPVLATSA